MKPINKYDFSFRVEMYPCKYIFIINHEDHYSAFCSLDKHVKHRESLIELKKEIAEHNFKNTDGQVYDSDGYIVLLLNRFGMTPFSEGRRAHELNHVVFATARHIGMKYSEDSEEFYCYLIGHLTEKFSKYIYGKNS